MNINLAAKAARTESLKDSRFWYVVRDHSGYAAINEDDNTELADRPLLQVWERGLLVDQEDEDEQN